MVGVATVVGGVWNRRAPAPIVAAAGGRRLHVVSNECRQQRGGRIKMMSKLTESAVFAMELIKSTAFTAHLHSITAAFTNSSSSSSRTTMGRNRDAAAAMMRDVEARNSRCVRRAHAQTCRCCWVVWATSK